LWLVLLVFAAAAVVSSSSPEKATSILRDLLPRKRSPQEVVLAASSCESGCSTKTPAGEADTGWLPASSLI
jgi:hypothetical protein